MWIMHGTAQPLNGPDQELLYQLCVSYIVFEQTLIYTHIRGHVQKHTHTYFTAHVEPFNPLTPTHSPR